MQAVLAAGPGSSRGATLGSDEEAVGFRDVSQKARVCRTLLARVGLEAYWSEVGPEPEALVATAFRSRDAKVLLGVCWVLWERTTTPALEEVMALSREHLRATGALLVALAEGPEALDDWIDIESGRRET